VKIAVKNTDLMKEKSKETRSSGDAGHVKTICCPAEKSERASAGSGISKRQKGENAHI